MTMFSVVVATFNRRATLCHTLTALVSQDHVDYEVIVVDDGSSDSTEELVRQEFPHVGYLRQTNRGPATARNAGIRAAGGEIVAFTDDDCLPPPDWLTRLEAGYARYPQVAGVGGYLEASPEVLRHNILARYERSIGWLEYEARDREEVGGFRCPAGGANNMSYRRSMLELVGGFDETFRFAAGEDADLKWRICGQGAQLLYIPVKVTHLQPYTFDVFRRQQILRGRGAAHFERKHAGRAPGPSRVMLRAGKRAARLARDLALGPERRLACVRFVAAWFDCYGQLLEVNRR